MSLVLEIEAQLKTKRGNLSDVFHVDEIGKKAIFKELDREGMTFSIYL